MSFLVDLRLPALEQCRAMQLPVQVDPALDGPKLVRAPAISPKPAFNQHSAMDPF
jgi:hypothetical protein